MYIEKELENITEDLASKSRLKKILKAYFKDIKREEGESLERIYKKSWKCLVLVLNKKQKKDLRQMETLFCKNMCYGIGFTIKKGIYAGFEQYFVQKSEKNPFEKFVYAEIMKLPEMKRYSKYFARQESINIIYEDLIASLSKENREYLENIYDILDSSLYNTFRYAFYLGYRYALSIVEETGDKLGTTGMNEKVRQTEYQLAFTATCER